MIPFSRGAQDPGVPGERRGALAAKLLARGGRSLARGHGAAALGWGSSVGLRWGSSSRQDRRIV